MTEAPIALGYGIYICDECRCPHVVLLGDDDVVIATIILSDEDALALANNLLSMVNRDTIGECLNARPS